jgi:spore maturation protein CgeB
MKILYCGLRHEYYDPSRAESFEYINFYGTLRQMRGVEAREVPFDGAATEGRAVFNRNVLAAVGEFRPDVVFAFMYTDEFEPEILDEIKKKAVTIAWFADDYWRFFNYSRFLAPRFTRAVTTSAQAYDWYQSAGIKNVIRSQWACNPQAFHPLEVGKRDIPVSFIGQRKGPRARVVERLRSAGVPVSCFGYGWEEGRVSREKMLEVVSRSKIALNLNERPGLLTPKVAAKLFLRKSLDRVVPDMRLYQNFQAWRHYAVPHIHARPFEFSGCGAFVLSGYAAGMEEYYEEGREMAFYRGTDDLIEKVRYYLERESEREAIAKAGYERTMREHTYEARFRALFASVGF